MNRFIFVPAAALQLLVFLSFTAAQTDASSSATESSPCATPSQRVTLTRQSNASSGSTQNPIMLSEQTESAARETDSASSSKPLELEFSGLKAVKLRDALITLCDEGAFPADNDPNPETVERILKGMLRPLGYAHARIHAFFDQQRLLRVFVEEGPRLSLAEIRFEGNRVFPHHELLATVHGCLKRYGERSVTTYDEGILDYCNRVLENQIRSFGYLQAKVVRTSRVKNLGYVVSYSIDEGTLYRVGKIKINGQRALTEQQIRSRLSLREGDIANGNKISRWLFEDIKDVYGDIGFIEYTAEPVPTFRERHGVVDFDVEIEEGKKFSLRSISFVGDLGNDINLENLMLVRAGDFYNQRLFRESIARLNDLGLFEPIDVDADVDWRTDQDNAELALVIKLKKRQ